MRDDDARDIIAMARGATTQWPVDDDTITFWMHSLKPLDAETATKAIMLGARSWDRFPAWSSFYEAYRACQRAAQSVDRQHKVIEEGKRGYATPEWVWVWLWCRCYRDPREERGFPQQDGIPELSMTTSDYEVLRQEWVSVGSPKEKTPVLMGSM